MVLHKLASITYAQSWVKVSGRYKTKRRYLDTYFFGILIVVSLSGITKKFDEASPEKSEASCGKQKVTQRRGRDVTFGTSA